jgi:hypothetical protein
MNEGETVKTKSRIEQDREILSSLKREMQEPRLTASVRDSQEAEAAQAAKARAAKA